MVGKASDDALPHPLPFAPPAPENCGMPQWTSHTACTDPGAHADALAAISRDPTAAVEAVQGLLIHGGALEHYGLAPQAFDRQTLPVKARLAALLSADASPLSVARPPAKRAVGTCRDYALLLCAIFRHQGQAARVRCGFASYLGGSPWEDHWICELEAGPRWTRIDAQLDPVLRETLDSGVEAIDLPPAAFMDAGEAWRACRSGARDPDDFGHGDANGLWFVFVNLMRDRLALNDCLTSDWDGWRAVAEREPSLSADQRAFGDELAGAASVKVLGSPWWVAR